MRLTAFEARSIDNKSALLSWNVVDEINLDGYIVERSADGRNFTEIGKVKAKNQSAYQMIDKLPASGVNYYRLRMVDKDNTFSTSEIRKVVFTTSGTVTLYPNPTSDRFFIEGLEGFEASAQITIYNEIGEQIWHGVMDGLSLAEQGIDMSSFAAGAYHVKVTSQEVNEIMRLVKQ